MRLLAKLPILVTVALLAGGAGGFTVLSLERAAAHDGARHPAQEGASLLPADESQAIEVEIVAREGGYSVVKGGQSNGRGFTLVAGADVHISLRNDDVNPHEFISPLFTRTDIHFSGKAIGVFRKEAAGFRLPPGQVLTLAFKAPFSDFPTFYDLIWCGKHQEHQSGGQEMLIVVTEKTAKDQ